MTGRDLIVYILSNRLENEKINENNPFLDIHSKYMDVNSVAILFGVGAPTVTVWANTGEFEGVVRKADNIYISKDEIIRKLSNDLRQIKQKR